MRTVGVVVNPIAGMGGRVGLKGTDGKVAEARERGAEPRPPDRAREALSALHDRAPGTELLAYGGEMGEDAARDAGFDPVVVGQPNGERRRPRTRVRPSGSSSTVVSTCCCSSVATAPRLTSPRRLRNSTPRTSPCSACRRA